MLVYNEEGLESSVNFLSVSYSSRITSQWRCQRRLGAVLLNNRRRYRCAAHSARDGGVSIRIMWVVFRLDGYNPQEYDVVTQVTT